MAIRIPWDQYEAAYLLLVCIDVIENHTDRATAIKKVSEALRKRALHNGIEIDSMYRNENGISMQMTIMTSLYLHKKSGLHGASKLFVDTVELYKKNPKAIKDRIENFVEGGEKLNMSNKEKFYKWLIASVRPGDVSNVRRRCDLVDVYIKNHKKFNTSIYELNNPQDVQRIKTFIEKDVFFKAKNSRQIYHILKSMEIFYDFVTDYSKTIAEEPNLCNLNIVNQDNKEKEFVKFSFEDKLAYTKPVSLEYNGNIYSDFSNWTQLYVRVLKILFKENKNILIDLYTSEYNWWVKNTVVDQTYTPAAIMAMLGDDMTVNSKKNIVSAYKNIFISTEQVGTELGLGLCDYQLKNGKRYLESITRGKWKNPDPRVILYSLFKFAEACGDYYQFTLKRLLNHDIESDGISPTQIFGLDRNTMEKLLTGLSVNYPEFINASFTLDLDNITLREGKTSQDVLELF